VPPNVINAVAATRPHSFLHSDIPLLSSNIPLALPGLNKPRQQPRPPTVSVDDHTPKQIPRFRMQVQHDTNSAGKRAPKPAPDRLLIVERNLQHEISNHNSVSRSHGHFSSHSQLPFIRH
jgi:hypothetical protein